MGATPTSLHSRSDESGSALLVIDMVSTWRFPDADKLLPAALKIAPTIARLKARCRAAGVAIVYVNDNQGRWRSDWRQLMEMTLQEGGDGAKIASMLKPDDDDYFVLKPKHSAFFDTPLKLLLEYLQVQQLILTGVSSDQCILATAATARMHDFDVTVPRDAVASQTAARTRASILHFEEVLKLPTTPTSRLRLPVAKAAA